MIPDELLRDVLEFALATLQMLDRRREGATIPKQVQPLLRFKKLDRVGLASLRRALDDHAELRHAISEGLRHDVVEGSGRPIDPLALLWLDRPEGWEAESERLVGELVEQKRLERLALEERGAEKRLVAAERHLERARGDVSRLERELGEERSRRQEVEQLLRDTTAKHRSMEQQVEDARSETRRAKQAAETAQAAASDARLALEAEAARRESAEAARSALETRLEDALRARAAADERSVPATGAHRVDDAALADAARALRAARNAVAQASDAVAGLVSGGAAAPGFAPAILERQRASSDAVAARRNRAERKPIAIPGGRYGDDLEVARYLFSVSGVVVIVDGYNVAMTGWPKTELETQRERLVAASEDLVRRLGPRVRIVFDGADTPGWASGRRLVNVEFSSAGTIADDVIRTRVAELPADQPVVVVSNDKELIASVRTMGANTVTSQQYLAAIGR